MATENGTTQRNIRLDPKLDAKLVKLAGKNRRKINEEAVIAIERHVGGGK